MIGLDTNILIRYLVHDDPTQTRIATNIIERRLTPAIPGFICLVVTAEMAWVLQRRYKATALEVVKAIEGLISQDSIVFEATEDVVQAIQDVKRENGEFADALIAALNARAGCSTTLTFDNGASKQRGFELAK